ncbi:MAG: fatty acid desaturase, partial [Alphaproteobacteria bacterium]
MPLSPDDTLQAGIPAASTTETARVWALHLLCFVLPLTCLAYLLTAPHPWWAAWPWFLVVVGSVIADMRSPAELRQPAAEMPQRPFDAVLYALVVLQVVNVALLVRMVHLHGFWNANALVGLLLVGIDSGYSGIVVAHELVHRPQHHMILLGRLLLSTVLYEHFTVEHVRGHHARVGTPEDPATARFGETALEFFRRTVPAQMRSAWRIANKRLGDEDMAWNDPRVLGERAEPSPPQLLGHDAPELVVAEQQQ